MSPSSSNRLWLVLAKEYMERVRTRGFIIGTILGPVVLAALILAPAWLSDRAEQEAMRVAVVDKVQLFGRLSATAEQMWASDGEPPMTLELYRAADPDAATEELTLLVEDGSFDGFLLLPAGFLEAGEATFYSDQISSLNNGRKALRGVLTQMLQADRLQERGISQADLASVLQPAQVRARHISDEEGAEAGLAARQILSFVLGMMLYFLLLQYGIQVMMSVIEDKSTRVVEVMLASVRPHELMGGKMVAQALVGLTQMAVWAGSSLAILHFSHTALPVQIDASVIPLSVWAAFATYFLLGYLMYSALYAAVGALSNNIQDAQPLSQPITFAIIIPFILSFAAHDSPDATWVQWLSVIPLTSPMVMFARVMSGKPEIWQVALSIVLLAATAWLFVRVAGRLFRLSILDFGGTKGWKQVLALLRD